MRRKLLAKGKAKTLRCLLMLRDEKEREEARLKAQDECEAYNVRLNDRAANRRAARELEKAGRTVALNLPWSRNRATRRHPPIPLSFEPDPDAPWRGGRMFLQRDKKRAEGLLMWVDEVSS